jgi:hypothetical protein
MTSELCGRTTCVNAACMIMVRLLTSGTGAVALLLAPALDVGARRPLARALFRPGRRRRRFGDETREAVELEAARPRGVVRLGGRAPPAAPVAGDGAWRDPEARGVAPARADVARDAEPVVLWNAAHAPDRVIVVGQWRDGGRAPRRRGHGREPRRRLRLRLRPVELCVRVVLLVCVGEVRPEATRA